MNTCEWASALTERLAIRIRRFARDRSGGIVVAFALLTPVLIICIGAAVDMARWGDARRKTAEALDAAVLAAARALQTNGGDKAAAVAVARTFYRQGISSRLSVISDNVDFAVSADGTEVTGSGNASISTPFLRMAGIRSLPLLSQSGADFSTAKLSVGKNSKKNLEIAMILDMSGSMATGTKLVDLRLAASDLVDIVVWEDQSTYTSKVSIIPYASAVNVGNYAAQARGGLLSGLCTSPGCLVYRFSSPYRLLNVFPASGSCVSERTGTQAYTDAAPSVAFVGRNYPAPANDCRTQAITPLTNDKSTLQRAITTLVAVGSTAGQVGVAWGWYSLSPNWNTVWPAASRPAAYTDENTEKIAILMTDGEYNSAYCNGVISRDSTYGSGSTADHIDCDATNGSSYDQAERMCSAMKTAGVHVYTVGFQIVDSQNALDLMRNCATDAGSFYSAADGENLRQAFHDIALRISTIYLSK